MSTAAGAKVMMLRDSARTQAATPAGPTGSALAEFEQVYRGNFDVVTAYFARRCAEPQIVADLTSETFVRAAGAFGSFDPRRGSARAWVFGIAAHVFAGHCAETANGRDAVVRLALWREIVRRHGADLAQVTRPAAKRARRARPRLLAGTSVALAGVGATLALVLSAASSPPAFAVSRNADGTYTVSLQMLAAIHGANARLAALGIRARLVEVTTGCTVKALPPAAVHAMQLAQSMVGRAAPQVATARLDPRKIPPGKWQLIPTWRVGGTVHVETAHLMQGQAPACISTVVAPPCQLRPMTVLRNGHLTQLAPAEANKRAEAALATHRAAVSRRNSKIADSANSGNSGNC
jgi:RNA polymerase sigma-70 factor (ECF subfamily)